MFELEWPEKLFLRFDMGVSLLCQDVGDPVGLGDARGKASA